MRQFFNDSIVYKTTKFLNSFLIRDTINFKGHSSVPGKPITLYGTSYALLTQYYLNTGTALDPKIKEFISSCQIDTGEFVGPELKKSEIYKDGHQEHILYHLTCTVVPVCLQFDIPIRYPLTFAHRFCNPDYLSAWLDSRDLTQAWYEGNNILFAGQLLVYLRDVEQHPKAETALDCWFEWLDTHADPATGLWGTNGYCNAMEAVYGGYHQLLVYYHENRPVPNPTGLVDTVLSLQHCDGSFHPQGNGGACEDVDCVDILVNMYKRFDYRRTDIRIALRRCLRHILALQNPDGGFPYNRDQYQSHLGIPDTVALPNVSTTFATWFRVHTLALIAQILPDEPALNGMMFGFTNNLSMGWHQTWSLDEARRLASQSSLWQEKMIEYPVEMQYLLFRSRKVSQRAYFAGRRFAGSTLRRLGLRQAQTK